MENVVNIDQPRCSRCGLIKSEDELNGYDPLAPPGKKYKNAYCRKLAERHSKKSNRVINKLLRARDTK